METTSVRSFEDALEEALRVLENDWLALPHAAILLDEFQFMDPNELLAGIRKASKIEGLTGVHLYGLNLTAKGEPWPAVAAVLPYADQVEVLTSVCRVCRVPANRTQRLTPWPEGVGSVAPGAGTDYEPRCAGCWTPNPSRA